MTVQVATLESVVNASASPVAVLSPDGRFIAVNAAFGDLVALAPERLVGESCTVFSHPDDVRIGLEAVEAIGQGRRSAHVRKRYLRSDGEVIWVDVVVSAMLDEHGEVFGLLSQVHPSDGPTPEQVTLAEAEARFQVALDSAPIGMAVVGLDGEWLQVNRVLCATLGRSRAELSRRRLRFHDVMHPDDLDRDVSIRRDLSRGAADWGRGVRRLLRRDGSWVWCDITVTVVRDGSDEPIHLLAHVIELSDGGREPGSSDFGDGHGLRELAAAADELLYYRLQLQPELMFEHVSESAASLCGYTAKDFYGDPRLMFDLIHPDDAPSLLMMLTDPDRAATEQLLRWRHRDGHEVLTKSRHTSVHRDGVAVALEGILVDMSRQREAEQARTASESRFRSLVQNSVDTVVVTDPAGRLTYATPSVERALGWSHDEVLGANVWDQVHPNDVERLRRGFAGSRRPFRMRLQTRAGHWRWFEAVVTDLTQDPAVAGVVINARDIHGQRIAEEALRANALTDALTQLPNRTLIEDRIQRALVRHRDDPATVAVFTIDLDRFKGVNDAHGYAEGDRVLMEVGARLLAVTPPSYTVGRFGADEFVVCGEGFPDQGAVHDFARSLRAAMTDRIELDGGPVSIDGSVGVAIADAPRISATELLRRSAGAMRLAKDAGGGTVAFYDPSVSGRARARAHREQGLLEAAGRGELIAHYQPIIDLESGRPVGAEALVRWDHPVDGLVPPEEFIGIAEETGAIFGIGAWVLDDACSHVRTWRELDGMDGFTVSVNLAARQLADASIVDVLAETLRRHELPNSALIVEVTESAALGHGHLEVLHAIHALGISIALDDFGTHYSSLSYLQRLPVRHLKIDRSFVTGIGTDRQRRAIVMATAQLGRALRLTTVAEGVEDAHEASELQLLGIDRGQGYHFARPMPPEALRAFLESSGSSSPE